MDGTLAPAPDIDLAAAKRHFAMLQILAAGLDGSFVLAGYGEGLPPNHAKASVRRGLAPETLAANAEIWARDRGRNIYAPAAITRSDLPAGRKGGEADVAHVLALVCDFDDADAARYHDRLPIAPHYVVETSPGRFQTWHMLEKPAGAAEAKEALTALVDFAKCDPSGKDASHVWRVPGLPNWPNAKKLAQGRSPEPFVSRVVTPWDGTSRVSLEALREALASSKPQTVAPQKAATTTTKATDLIGTIDFDSLPSDLRDVIVNGVPKGIEDRSGKFHFCVANLKERRYSADAIEALLSVYPNGIAEKYKGRLRREIERAYNKVSNKPAAKDEFKPVSAPLTLGSDVELARNIFYDLQSKHGDVIHAEGRFWFYGDTHWQSIDEGELRRVLHRYDGARVGKSGCVKLSKSKIDGVIHEMAAMAARPDFFANAPAGINCSSGFIRFNKVGQPSLELHSPDHRARHVLPGAWKPGATWHREGSFLGRLLDGCFLDDPDKAEKVDLIGEVFGCAALGYATKLMKPKAIVLVGPSAENGKSQVIDSLEGLLPAAAVASVPPTRFNDDRFTAQLVGKLLNVAGELGTAQAIASDIFKSIVTGDLIAARDVYQSAVSFRPIAMHCFATNHLPSFAGGFDRGVQRRLLVVPFNRVIPADERIEHLGKRIVSEEPNLLLAFAVEGASRLIARRYFNESESAKKALKDWIFGADPVLAWFEERIDFEEGARLQKQAAYRDFRAWAKCEGFDERRLPSIQNFVGRIKAHDARIGDARNKKEGRFFVNTRLSDSAPPESPSTLAGIFSEGLS